MSNQLQFAPFRPVNDFVAQAENYAIPDFKDLVRLNNRITNNLLYYQTNYFVVFLVIFVLVSMIHPLQFITGLTLFIGLCVAFVHATNRNVELQRFKRDKPFLTLLILILVGGTLFRLFGSLVVFLFSVCLPLSLIFIHAALRLRNLKNKVANKVEMIGIARTPMGVILEQLDLILSEKLDKD